MRYREIGNPAITQVRVGTRPTPTYHTNLASRPLNTAGQQTQGGYLHVISKIDNHYSLLHDRHRLIGSVASISTRAERTPPRSPQPTNPEKRKPKDIGMVMCRMIRHKSELSTPRQPSPQGLLPEQDNTTRYFSDSDFPIDASELRETFTSQGWPRTYAK